MACPFRVCIPPPPRRRSDVAQPVLAVHDLIRAGRITPALLFRRCRPRKKAARQSVRPTAPWAHSMAGSVASLRRKTATQAADFLILQMLVEAPPPHSHPVMRRPGRYRSLLDLFAAVAALRWRGSAQRVHQKCVSSQHGASSDTITDGFIHPDAFCRSEPPRTRSRRWHWTDLACAVKGERRIHHQLKAVPAGTTSSMPAVVCSLHSPKTFLMEAARIVRRA